MMITATPVGCAGTRPGCGTIHGGCLDGALHGAGGAGMHPDGGGAIGVMRDGARPGILGGAGGRPMQGRDGITRRAGDGATMPARAGG